MTLANDCIPEQHQLFAKLKVRGINGKRGVIVTNFRNKADIELFSLRVTDTCHFDNIDFVCGTQTETRGGSCIQTEQGLSKYYIRFSNCRWLGDWRFNIQSSQGDSTSVIDLKNCELNAYFNCIQFYAQTGAKTILMDNVTMQSLISHCYYGGPGVNTYWNRVIVKGSGKRGVDFRSDNIYPFAAKFQIFKNCGNAPGAVSLDKEYGGGTAAPQWHLWGQGVPTVIVDSCQLPAGDWQGNFAISNTTMINGGNGTNVWGNATYNNCRGEITSSGKTVITNSAATIKVMSGADITCTNSSIGLYHPFPSTHWKAYFKSCNIADFEIKAEASDVTFDGCRFGFGQYTGIRAFSSPVDGIRFIGDSYPIATY